jgi:hypothetical protein
MAFFEMGFLLCRNINPTTNYGILKIAYVLKEL